jgi:hypothetical protein
MNGRVKIVEGILKKNEKKTKRSWGAGGSV